LTRTPESDAAQALEGLGAQVVKADLTRAEEVERALKDCWGVFGVTNFYDSVLPPRCLTEENPE